MQREEEIMRDSTSAQIQVKWEKQGREMAHAIFRQIFSCLAQFDSNAISQSSDPSLRIRHRLLDETDAELCYAIPAPLANSYREAQRASDMPDKSFQLDHFPPICQRSP